MLIRQRTITTISLFNAKGTITFDVPVTEAEVDIWVLWAGRMGTINKVYAIKMIRSEFGNCGLREAKHFVEHAINEVS